MIHQEWTGHLVEASIFVRPSLGSSKNILKNFLEVTKVKVISEVSEFAPTELQQQCNPASFQPNTEDEHRKTTKTLGSF